MRDEFPDRFASESGVSVAWTVGRPWRRRICASALAAQDLRVPYVLVLPLPVQQFTEGWSKDERATFEFVTHGAATTEIVEGAEDSYQQRSRRLVTEAQLLVAIWTNTQGGGTADTVLFAPSSRLARLRCAAPKVH